MHLGFHFVACVFALALAGCSDKDSPRRFDLSGAVNYDGKPVPAGYIELRQMLLAAVADRARWPTSGMADIPPCPAAAQSAARTL